MNLNIIRIVPIKIVILIYFVVVMEVNNMELMKREFSQNRRERLAREGAAMPDGSYPIVNRDDLMNAIRSWGRGGAREDVKRHIMRRAKEIGAENMIPENWKNPDAKKSIWAGVLIPRSTKP